MKLFKYLLSVLIITSILLTYTHQQVKLLKISYEIKDAEEQVTALLDQNRSLRYNVTRLGSSENLAKFASAKEPDLTTLLNLQQIVWLGGFETGEFDQLSSEGSFINFFIPTAEASID